VFHFFAPETSVGVAEVHINFFIL